MIRTAGIGVPVEEEGLLWKKINYITDCAAQKVYLVDVDVFWNSSRLWRNLEGLKCQPLYK